MTPFFGVFVFGMFACLVNGQFGSGLQDEAMSDMSSDMGVSGSWQKEHPPDPKIGGMHKVRLELIVRGRSHPSDTTHGVMQ